MILSDEIEAMWDIIETEREHALYGRFPYLVRCQRNGCASMGFPCRTLEEARMLLGDILVKAQQLNRPVAIV